MESDKTVSLAPYIPFSNARKQDGQHADAFQIWHPVKDTVNGEMLIQFINEASRTPLRSRNIIPAVLPSVGLDDDFYFNLRPGSENGGFYIGSCSRGPVLWGYRYPKSWVCFDKSRARK